MKKSTKRILKEFNDINSKLMKSTLKEMLSEDDFNLITEGIFDTFKNFIKKLKKPKKGTQIVLDIMMDILNNRVKAEYTYFDYEFSGTHHIDSDYDTSYSNFTETRRISGVKLTAVSNKLNSELMSNNKVMYIYRKFVLDDVYLNFNNKPLTDETKWTCFNKKFGLKCRSEDINQNVAKQFSRFISSLK